ncbi:MAG: VOC family protein [Phycisphaerae bacterium]|nr:VOC family protein [Phycisphaerae bacterium]
MPNRLCHFEFVSNDPAKCRDFYSKVFEWDLRGAPEQDDYTMVFTGESPTGGITKRSADCPAPTVGVYFKVDDIDETLARAVQAGGRVIVARRAIHGIGSFAVFLDPENIGIGVFQDE